MAKVFGVHEFELKAGVKQEDFERYVKDEVYPAVNGHGMAITCMRGDRGTRDGKYLWIMEFGTVAERNRFFPGSGPQTEAWKSVSASWWAKLARFVAEGWRFTDYVVVGK